MRSIGIVYVALAAIVVTLLFAHPTDRMEIPKGAKLIGERPVACVVPFIQDGTLQYYDTDGNPETAEVVVYRTPDDRLLAVLIFKGDTFVKALVQIPGQSIERFNDIASIKQKYASPCVLFMLAEKAAGVAGPIVDKDTPGTPSK
jgi:hypothetical protein